MTLSATTAGGFGAKRGQLVSLWDLMDAFNPAIASWLIKLHMVVTEAKASPNDAATTQRLSYLRVTTLEDIGRFCVMYSLTGAQATLTKLSDAMAVDDPMVLELVTRLQEGIVDELKLHSLLCLSLADSGRFENPCKAWGKILDKFPACSFDVEEANKCFALARYTACVFHLMRALGPVLEGLAVSLSLPKDARTWGDYLAPMSEAIRKTFPNKDRAHEEKRQHYSSLEAQLRAIKRAWRNPTMHEVEKTYTEEMARTICDCVQGFMLEASK
jgi:hypothetical protein